MLLLKLLVILCFIVIFYQDNKTRMVYWFLYPLVGIGAFFIQVFYNSYIITLLNSLLNIITMSIIILISYLYSKFIMKKEFINGSIGIGDILLFIFLCFTFSSIAFIILMAFSLIFSLLLHQIAKQKKNNLTVPLAGYISLFFAAIYIVSFFITPSYLYSY